jgi:serine protease Do
MRRKDFVATVAAGAIGAVVVSMGAQLAAAHEAVKPPRAGSVAPLGAPDSFANIVARVAPAVVSVEVVQKPGASAADAGDAAEGDEDLRDQLRRLFPDLPAQPPAAPTGPARVAGSGFFVSPDGYIVTNDHVIEGAQKITVHTNDDRTLTATLVGADSATDLAVLKVAGGGHPFVNFESRARPRVGDWVVALGNPFDLGGTATAGIVSALKRPNISGSSYVDYMQIDAPINRGNSGGPTFDVYGRVVGVNSAIYSPSGGSVGIGFDIPADVASKVVNELIGQGRVVRGYVGAGVQDITPSIAAALGVRSTDGALVDDVTEGGPSARAGLRTGDIIEAVDGRPVTSAAGMTRAVSLARPGQVVRLVVNRNGQQLNLDLTAAERPSEDALEETEAAPADVAAPRLGLTLSPAPGGGLAIDKIDPSSDAAQKGLEAGDVIRQVGARPVNSAADLATALAASNADRKDVLVLFERKGRKAFVALAPAAPSGAKAAG